MVNKRLEVCNKLKVYNNFQECIIEDILFTEFGTSVEITFNNIWSNAKEIRKDIDKKQIVKIKFFFVNKFLIENNLSRDFVNMINWGINEVSIIKLIERSDNDFMRVEILWETERKIIIEFRDMNIE
jgi:hypothetical protein